MTLLDRDDVDAKADGGSDRNVWQIHGRLLTHMLQAKDNDLAQHVPVTGLMRLGKVIDLQAQTH